MEIYPKTKDFHHQLYSFSRKKRTKRRETSWTNLEIAVRILLLEHEPQRLLDVDQESSRGGFSDFIYQTIRKTPPQKISRRREKVKNERAKLTMAQSSLPVHEIVVDSDSTSRRSSLYAQQ